MKNGKAPTLYKNPYSTDKYFACPCCGSPVGGYRITGTGEDDWETYKHKFCPECGQKISWYSTKWSELY